MTERNATGSERQVVCPFVAFDDDRDHRSSVPDHRQRCFAESPAAARALAHQAAYCLSSAFPGCPTFIDWARREAAPPKDEPIHGLRVTPSAPRQAERPGDAARRAIAPQDPPSVTQRPRRTDWTAPPPWAPDAGAEARSSMPAARDDVVGRAAAVPDRDEVPPAVDDDVSPGLGAWSGSALGGIASPRDPARDAASRSVEAAVDPDRRSPASPPEPAFLAGRSSRSGQGGTAPFAPLDPDVARGAARREPTRSAATGSTPGVPAPRSAPGRSRDHDRPIERGRDRAIGPGPDRPAADPSAPSWERPRRFEAYPSLKSSGSRVASLPRPVLYGLIVLLVGVGLFTAPFLLRGLTGDGAAASSPTPSSSASPTRSPSASITPKPSPSATVYTVKAGDLLSVIAAKYGVTVDQIVKVNPQIKDPDKLQIGDRLVIPPAVAPAITDGTITAPSP